MRRDTFGQPDPKPVKAEPKAPKPLRRVPVQRYSEKQVDITQRLHAVYNQMDADAEAQGIGIHCHCCAGPCLDRLIDHSHTVSQDRCKKLGTPELITDPDNIVHSCRTAHRQWDNYEDGKFLSHVNFEKRMEYVKLHDPHVYERRMSVWAEFNKPTATV